MFIDIECSNFLKPSISCLVCIVEVCNVITSYRKEGSRNLKMAFNLTSELTLSLKGQGRISKSCIFRLLWQIEVCNVILSLVNRDQGILKWFSI